jgi:uncharacterized protein YicC (UPF0701 family)
MSTLEIILSILAPLLTAGMAILGSIITKRYSDKIGVEEAKALKDALHQSVENALKAAIARRGESGLATAASIVGTPAIFSEVIRSVHEKNPEAVDKLGVTDKIISDLMLSKVPDVLAAAPAPVIIAEAVKP